MSKILAFFMSIITFFMGLFGFGTKVDVTPDDTSFEPVMRFVVSSDSHIVSAGDKRSKRVTKMLNTAYAFARESDYKTVDAAVFAGDLTDKGLSSQFVAFSSAVQTAIKPETKLMAIVAKAHDGYQDRADSRQYISDLLGVSPDFHEIVNGFHFIGISAAADSSVHYTEQQIKWLDEQIAAAVADDPNKPVFVFQHEHVKNTVYGSGSEDGWGVEFFTDILNKYPQVVHISGHSHYPANDPRAIWQGVFTAINDGGLNYFEFTVDGENCVHPDGNDSMAQMLIVEVDKNNAVRVVVYDLTGGQIMTEYLIDNVTDANKTKYAPANRKALANAPVFEGTLKVEKKASGYTVTVPSAKVNADDAVFIYRIRVTDKDGKEIYSDKQLGSYYYSLEDNGASFKVKDVPSGATVTVTAEDVWGLASAPLTAVI